MFSNKEINSKIAIYDVKLDLPITPNGDENAESTTPIGYTGEQAHKDLFFEYATEHLKLGNDGRVYYSPNGVDSNPPIVQAPELDTPPAESSESSQESSDTSEPSQESSDTPPDVESVLEEIDRQFQDEDSDLVTELINNLN